MGLPEVGKVADRGCTPGQLRSNQKAIVDGELATLSLNDSPASSRSADYTAEPAELSLNEFCLPERRDRDGEHQPPSSPRVSLGLLPSSPRPQFEPSARCA